MWRTPPGSQCGHQEPSFPKAMGTSQMQSKIKKGRKKFKQKKNPTDTANKKKPNNME